MQFIDFHKIKVEILESEIETILHPSPLRLKWLGVFTLIGHPLFWVIWDFLIPQPYENLWVRILMASLGFGLLGNRSDQGASTAFIKRYFSIVFWIQLPLFFSWMYWKNDCNPVWLATMAAMVLIYYHLTDWRLATLGLITGVLIGTGAAYFENPSLPYPASQDIVVFIFAWMSALTLAASSANLRRERIRNSLAIMGIMAHEIRTPLAIASMIGKSIQDQSDNPHDKDRSAKLNDLSVRLEKVTRAINHHIDAQMMNARFLQLPRVFQNISAKELVETAIAQYPFISNREQNCVALIFHRDFCFQGSHLQFCQVLNNLIKNALYSLKSGQTKFSSGDIQISIGLKDTTGRISVEDKGMGIDPSLMTRIFEPFFSTSLDTGHGLGLAYCRQVVESSGGTISVKSSPVFGATFIIDLPAVSTELDTILDNALASLPPP